MHLDIVLSLRVRATADQGSPQPTAVRLHENVDPDDSDYESDTELEIEDQGAYNEIENDRRDDSDAEDTSEPPARRRPSSQEIIPRAGSHSAMLLTIQSSIWPQQMTPGALSRRKRTLI